MHPILLRAHEWSIMQIKHNHLVDLLLTLTTASNVSVWYSVNGKRLGTYMDYTGAVWCVDVVWDTTHVLTGSLDNSCCL